MRLLTVKTLISLLLLASSVHAQGMFRGLNVVPAGGGGGVAPSFVQLCGAGNSAPGGSSISCTFGSNLGAHHFAGMLFYWGSNAGTVSTVSSTLGLSYTILNSGYSNAGGSITTAAVYICDTGSGGAETITANLTVSETNLYWVGLEASGNATSACLEGTDNKNQVTTNTTSTFQSASLATTKNDLLIGLFGTTQGCTTWSAPSDGQIGTPTIPTGGSNLGVALSYIREGSTATYKMSVTCNQTSQYNAFMLAVHS